MWTKNDVNKNTLLESVSFKKKSDANIKWKMQLAESHWYFQLIMKCIAGTKK